ncbi:hypothetical protein IAU60_001101 [Kwoniella sp. DSM 27419]
MLPGQGHVGWSSYDHQVDGGPSRLRWDQPQAPYDPRQSSPAPYPPFTNPSHTPPSALDPQYHQLQHGPSPTPYPGPIYDPVHQVVRHASPFTVEAVPSPTPRVSYDAPVFQTFQDRKRAKAMAVQAQAAGSPTWSGQSTSPVNTRSDNLSSQPPVLPPLPLRSTSRPTAATMAMMGSPSSHVGPPPMPPVRARSPATAALPSPTRPPTSRALLSPGSIPSSRAVETSLPVTPLQSQPSSPLSPTIPNVHGAQPHPLQAQLERSDTISSVKSLDRMGFSTSPVKRALPKPPVGVNSSRSLDRGIPTGSGSINSLEAGTKKTHSRKQPSVVDEHPADAEGALPAGMEALTINKRSPRSPAVSVNRPPSPSIPIQAPSIVLPEPDEVKEADRRTPAKFSPLPAIVVPDSDGSSTASTDDEAEGGAANNMTPKVRTATKSSSPGFEFSGLPTIAVSSSNTADETEYSGISIVVPSVTFGNPATPSAEDRKTIPSAPLSTNRTPDQRIYHAGSAILCAGCNNPIIGRIVNAMNQRWHPQCFGCAECGELLEHVSSYEWEGKAYCHLDYHDKFAHRCHHCRTPIVETRFVTLNDPILGQRYYHELHFFCSECGDPFLDPSKSSAPGTETSRSTEEDDEGETNAFVIHRGHPYCERCHLRLHKPKCKACNQPIPDVAINAMGAKWHQECFLCSRCGDDFANNLFFPRDGKAFCTSCYEGIIASESA